jgi:hypothetical protein
LDTTLQLGTTSVLVPTHLTLETGRQPEAAGTEAPAADRTGGLPSFPRTRRRCRRYSSSTALDQLVPAINDEA